MQPVQEEGEQLLAVLLLVAGKLWRESAHCHLESPGNNVIILPAPHVLDELAKCPRDLSLHPQWVVLVDVLGLEKLTSAFGLLIMFRGVATIMGPPLAGAVQQWAGSYNMSFYVAGALLILAGLVSLMADMVRRRDKRGPAELN